MKARIYRDEIKPEDLRHHVNGWLEITIEDRPATNIEVVHSGDAENTSVVIEDASLPNPKEFRGSGVGDPIAHNNGVDIVISRHTLARLISRLSLCPLSEAMYFVDGLVLA